MAEIGFGTKFFVGTAGGSPVYTEIAKVQGAPAPSMSRDMVDATHNGSPNMVREYIAGPIDPGEMTILLQFAPGDAGSTEMMKRFVSGDVENFRIKYPEGDDWDFRALVQGFALQNEMDSVRTFECTLKLSGMPDFLAEAVA